MTWALVALAGSLGAVSRFAVDGLIRSRSARLGWATTFPWATLVVNVTGSLLLGLLTGLVVFDGSPSLLALVLGTGFCGGYTTFSTTSIETLRLLQHQRYWHAAANAALTLTTTVAAGAVGLWLSRW